MRMRSPTSMGSESIGEEAAGLEVHEFADDVRAGQVDVVLALAGGQLGVQLAGFGVDQVGGELARVAAEQRVRQGDVAPVEAQEVEAHEQQGERVDEARRRVLAHRQGEQRAVGERELQVLGDEDRVEFLAVGALASRDDGDRLDGRGVQAREVAQYVVLVVGDRRHRSP